MTEKAGKYLVSLSDDDLGLPRFDPGSVDNVGGPEREYVFGDSSEAPSSRYRITVAEEKGAIHSVLLFASLGTTSVHENSLIIGEGRCFVAIGPFVCCLSLPTLVLAWTAQVDTATCFGIYGAGNYDGFLCHVECAISRWTFEGRQVWAQSGRDIFTEGFCVQEQYFETIDFEGTHYRFELADGRATISMA